MDALERLFKLDGRDKRYPELFAKIKRFKDILLAPEIQVPKGGSTSAAVNTGNKRLNLAVAIGLSFAAGIAGGILYNSKPNKEAVQNNSQQPQPLTIKMDDFLKHNTKAS